MVEETLKQFKDEICRHFDVVAEKIEDKIGVVSEQVATNTEKIGILQQDMNKVKEDIGIIKTDIGFIKNELKQKVDRDEFIALERRVGLLEGKTR